MSRYWKRKLWEEYGVIVKKIRHLYNPLTSWGFSNTNYIVYYYVSTGYGSLIENYDTIFHSAKDIVNFLESKKKQK